MLTEYWGTVMLEGLTYDSGLVIAKIPYYRWKLDKRSKRSRRVNNIFRQVGTHPGIHRNGSALPALAERNECPILIACGDILLDLSSLCRYCGQETSQTMVDDITRNCLQFQSEVKEESRLLYGSHRPFKTTSKSKHTSQSHDIMRINLANAASPHSHITYRSTRMRVAL